MKLSQGPLVSLFADDAGVPLQQRLFDRLRGAILSGAIRPGDRLPSTRTLSRDLGVSRNTVVAAVDRLTAEGYLEARVGSGTFVSRSLPEEAMAPAVRLAPTPRPVRPVTVPAAGAELLPFRPGVPAIDQFEVETWRKLLAKRWRDAAGLLLGGDTSGGWLPLRRILAAHLQTSRGLDCDAEQILVLPGRTAALQLAAALVLAPGARVWVEDPGCPVQRAVLEGRGLHPVPVPVDLDGLDVERAQRLAADADAALVTPGWQFPLGGSLGMRRRQSLLAWARRTGGWVIEDDCDGGIRYSGRPLASLQGLDDGGRVLHLGCLEKTLVPALRLAWLVVPPELVGAAQALRQTLDLAVALPEQMAVHDFLAEGHFASHLRRARCAYAERQETLLAAAKRHWQGALTLSSAPAGLHLAGRIDPSLGLADTELEALAAAHRLELPALSGFRTGLTERDMVVLGYAAFTPEKIGRAAERLALVLDKALPARRRGVFRAAVPAE